MSIYSLYMLKTLNSHKEGLMQAHPVSPSPGSIFSCPTVKRGYLSRLILPVSCEDANEAKVKEQGPLTTIDRLTMGPTDSKSSVTIAEVEAFIRSQKPMDRLKAMYSRSSLGEISPEIDMVINLTKNSAFLMFLIMSVAGSRAAKEAHIRKSKHVKYETRFQALRAYHDAVFFGGLRSGLKWAFKTGFFTAVFMLTSQSIAVYRNKTSIIEYIAAGGLTCALLRFNVGPRGMFAGGVIGAALGMVGGTAFYAMFNYMGETQEKRHFMLVRERLNELRDVDLLTASPVTEGTVTATVAANTTT